MTLRDLLNKASELSDQELDAPLRIMMNVLELDGSITTYTPKAVEASLSLEALMVGPLGPKGGQDYTDMVAEDPEMQFEYTCLIPKGTLVLLTEDVEQPPIGDITPDYPEYMASTGVPHLSIVKE